LGSWSAGRCRAFKYRHLRKFPSVLELTGNADGHTIWYSPSGLRNAFVTESCVAFASNWPFQNIQPPGSGLRLRTEIYRLVTELPVTTYIQSTFPKSRTGPTCASAFSSLFAIAAAAVVGES